MKKKKWNSVTVTKKVANNLFHLQLVKLIQGINWTTCPCVMWFLYSSFEEGSWRKRLKVPVAILKGTMQLIWWLLINEL